MLDLGSLLVRLGRGPSTALKYWLLGTFTSATLGLFSYQTVVSLVIYPTSILNVSRTVNQG